ncbi:MAG TPA: DUF6703 family protein [Frankiaceae bacterium]|nr:DUF6703 family protein [Frankiaceae bacterium]
MSPKKRAPRPARRTAPRKGTPAKPRGGGGGRTPQAAPSRQPFYTQGGSAFRHSVERASAPALVLLTQMPRIVMMLAPLALLLLGFFLPLAIGLVFLVVFFLFTGWLAYLSWPRTDVRAKLIRLAMFALVIALAVIRIGRA